MTVPVTVATGHRFQAVIKESVEVKRPILMPFRHKDVFQTMPLDLVVAPLGELAHHLCRVVAVYFGGV